MGGNLYCRASGDALFKITRPVRERGIGVDRLPTDIRESSVLTGSDLARLANVRDIPDATVRQQYADDPVIVNVQEAYTHSPDPTSTETARAAHEFLQQGEINKAWTALLVDKDM